MPRFDATINGKSLASYGITPTTVTVPQPDAKTYQADIPGRDGMLDYTDAFGVIRYDNRTVTVEAYEIGDIATRIDHRRAICSDMHGMSCKLSLSTLDGYTFTGRCSVEYEEDGSQTAYTLSFDCEPYMSAGERTFYANCAGGADLIFISGDKPVKPRIEVQRRSIIVFEGNQYEVDKGTWTFDDIIFKRGRNEIYINTYTEPGTTTWGDLQSMTWEQIGWHHRQSEASGALVNVTDALQARTNKLGVQGKSVQDGTPTPDAPVEVDVVDGPVVVQRTGSNLFNVAATPSSASGSTVTILSNSSFLLTTVYAGTYRYVQWALNLRIGQVYTISVDEIIGGNSIGCLTSSDTGSILTLDNDNKSATFTATKDTYYLRCSITSATPVNAGTTMQIDGLRVNASTQQLYAAYTSNQQTITLPSDHNYLASLPDGTRDELVLRSDGVAVMTERVGKVVFDGSADEAWGIGSTGRYTIVVADVAPVPIDTILPLFCNRFVAVTSVQTYNKVDGISGKGEGNNGFYFYHASINDTVANWTSWLAANPVTVYCKLKTPATSYSADNGTTWSTTDPAAGQSAIPLQKGTNNVWCTDALSPTITLNYDTQERTRKQRVSELYWRKNPPQRRLTWGQLATHTWGEIGSKPVQEWYYSGTAEVVENAYINYEIGEL